MRLKVDPDEFIENGFVKIEGAFGEDLAEDARAILWRDVGANEHDPKTWTKPVVRLGMYHQEPFQRAANTPVLHQAYDAIVGKGRWRKPMALGTFPVRFPIPVDVGDTGWHIDVSFGETNPDFMEWRANVFSKGRHLLMLFLFSDVDGDDAPTRIRIGSHKEIARVLEPGGEAGLTLRQLANDGFARTENCKVAYATGEAGTVYLCHPFLVHAAQIHRGKSVKFMAQPPLLPVEPVCLDRADKDYSPLEISIRSALAERR